MLYARLFVSLGLAVALTSLKALAAQASFPTVPPPSPDITKNASNTLFPVVPPPSRPVRQTTEFPTAPAPSHVSAAASPGQTGLESSQAVTTSFSAGHEMVRVENGQNPTQNERDLETAIKTGKAPASAYATPQAVEIPKNFAGKEAELQALLNQYKANQITPAEYHRRRAEIIARP